MESRLSTLETLAIFEDELSASAKSTEHFRDDRRLCVRAVIGRESEAVKRLSSRRIATVVRCDSYE